jgi:uncharacterized repeat protein (TIGR01451 family)/CSLREA domain-containing protein
MTSPVSIPHLLEAIMFRHRTSRPQLLFLLGLAALPGCREDAASPVGPRPQFAQGDNGVWTVNSLADPGDGTCDDAECTLREAIAAAAAGDKVVFAGGLQGDIKLTDGQLNIEQNLTVDGAGRIAVDAQSNGRVMVLNGSGNAGPVTVVLDGLTFKHGSAGGGGGVALFSNITATIQNSSIVENHSGSVGGGLFVGISSKLTLIRSTADGNSAETDGGGIYSEGTLDVVASTISGNTVHNQGGGVHVNGGSASFARSTISSNLIIIPFTLNSNAASIYLHAGSLSLRSSVVIKNDASSIFIHDGLVAESEIGQPATVTYANTILDGLCLSVSNGTFTSLGHNLTTGCASPVAGDIGILPSQLFTEVLEEELEDNGGPTKTHALIPRSRAADAGYCPGETEDQRGLPRPVDAAVMPNALDACDIGPYELQGPVAIVADLMISQAVNKTSVKQGELLTYSIRVQNLGPQAAPNVVVTDLLPSGATFVSATHNKGTHTAPPKGETGTVTWSVGEMLDQANEVATITVTVLVKGKTSITNKASVTSDAADPNMANNSSAITVSVVSGTTAGGGKPRK